MSTSNPLQSMEQSAYRRAYSDGVVDLFVGISLLWMGAAWIWLPDLAALAGILPAVFVPVAFAARKQFVERRLGYVRWSAPRRRREKKNLVTLLGAGMVLLLGAVLVFFVVEGSLVDEPVLDFLLPGLMAWLLALLSLGLAALLESWRFFLYGAFLVLGGLVTALLGANPGWPLLVAGAVVTVTGLVMLAAFNRENPIVGST